MSPHAPTARRLVAHDAQAYHALRREMLVDSPWAFASSPDDDRLRDLADLRAALAQPEQAFLAVDAPDGSRLLAAAGAHRDPKLKRAHVAWVWGVYVTPSARGRGLGRAVVSAAVAAARAWPRVECVCLSVSAHPAAAPALRLYQSLGFEAWGAEPDALRVNGESWGEVHLRLAL